FWNREGLPFLFYALSGKALAAGSFLVSRVFAPGVDRSHPASCGSVECVFQNRPPSRRLPVSGQVS
ncbi:MAG: hypothetical protein ACKO81_01335, partial [Planctomycetota bacterium]